ncbi:MAG: tetratricopeptide repeat protein [Burkholderiales bacterium]
MSLLLEALKKAELAKQGAQPPAESAAREAPSETEPAAEPATPVFTRERLPDITQPLEILTDDLPSAGQRATISPATQPEPPVLEVRAEPPLARHAAGKAEPAAQRQAARQLFEAKEMDYNPRRPFHLILGALIVVALGYGGYVWWQTQPKSIYSAQAPSETPPQVATAKETPGIPQSPAPVAAIAPAASPDAPAARATRPAARQRTAPSGSTFVRRESAKTASVADAERPGSRTPILITPPALEVDPLIERAYEAFQRDDLASARGLYEQVLARQSNHRDALLGLAAIDIRNGHYDTAEMRYQKLLEADPRDAQAQAALIALRGQVDPVLSESRIKTLLATRPDATVLYFALGNQYALQSRWPEAQAAYFKAYSADPENPDYAFNLAISLDQLRQTRPALDYYRRALNLAETRTGSFDRALVDARIRELGK